MCTIKCSTKLYIQTLLPKIRQLIIYRTALCLDIFRKKNFYHGIYKRNILAMWQHTSVRQSKYHKFFYSSISSVPMEMIKSNFAEWEVNSWFLFHRFLTRILESILLSVCSCKWAMKLKNEQKNEKTKIFKADYRMKSFSSGCFCDIFIIKFKSNMQKNTG